MLTASRRKRPSPKPRSLQRPPSTALLKTPPSMSTVEGRLKGQETPFIDFYNKIKEDSDIQMTELEVINDKVPSPQSYHLEISSNSSHKEPSPIQPLIVPGLSSSSSTKSNKEQQFVISCPVSIRSVRPSQPISRHQQPSV